MSETAQDSQKTDDPEAFAAEPDLTPEVIRGIIDDPPILPNEDTGEFERLFESFEMTDVGDASTPTEFLMVFRATVLTLEIIRLERTKIAILRNQHRPATESFFRKIAPALPLEPIHIGARRDADKYYADDSYRTKSDQRFEAAGYAPDAADGEAFLRALPQLATIERLIASAEKRLFNFLNELERRYATRSAKLKSAVKKAIIDAV